MKRQDYQWSKSKWSESYFIDNLVFSFIVFSFIIFECRVIILLNSKMVKWMIDLLFTRKEVKVKHNLWNTKISLNKRKKKRRKRNKWNKIIIVKLKNNKVQDTGYQKMI